MVIPVDDLRFLATHDVPEPAGPDGSLRRVCSLASSKVAESLNPERGQAPRRTTVGRSPAARRSILARPRQGLQGSSPDAPQLERNSETPLSARRCGAQPTATQTESAPAVDVGASDYRVVDTVDVGWVRSRHRASTLSAPTHRSETVFRGRPLMAGSGSTPRSAVRQPARRAQVRPQA